MQKARKLNGMYGVTMKNRKMEIKMGDDTFTRTSTVVGMVVYDLGGDNFQAWVQTASGSIYIIESISSYDARQLEIDSVILSS